MFYESAGGYWNTHGVSSTRQAMAAYAAQALSQTSPQNQMKVLESLQKQGKLDDFLRAAVQGEARYGSSQFKSSEPLDSVARLMSNVAKSNDPKAHDVQTNFFTTVIKTIEDKPEVRAYYVKDSGMKDALASTFQKDYDGIVTYYRKDPFDPHQVDATMNADGLTAFKEFFRDVLFSPPPTSGELSTARFFPGKMTEFAIQSRNMTDDEFLKTHWLSTEAYAQLMGDQAGALTKALAYTLTAIQQNAGGNAQSLVDQVNAFSTASEGAVSVGLAEAPEVAAPLLFVLEAARLISRKAVDDNKRSDLQQAKDELSQLNINVSYSLGMYNFEDAPDPNGTNSPALTGFINGQKKAVDALS
jgi:hypothetical protein